MRMLLPLLLVVVAAAIVLLITGSPRRGRPLDARDSLDHGDRVQASDIGHPATAVERRQAVERVREQLRRAEARYAARVASAEEGLTRARQDTEVLRVGGVVLGRCTVLIEGREHELTEQTRFRFEHEGAVAYRVDEIGDGSRIVEDDRRHGRLTIAGEGWEEAVDVIPADFAEAERLVAAGQAATRSLPAARREQTGRVERAWAELEAARADRAEVDEARLTLEDLLGAGPGVWDVPRPPEDEEDDGERQGDGEHGEDQEGKDDRKGERDT